MLSLTAYILLVALFVAPLVSSAPPMQSPLQAENFGDLLKLNTFSNDVLSGNQQIAFDSFNDNTNPSNYLISSNASPLENSVYINANDNEFAGGFNTPSEGQSSNQQPINLQTFFSASPNGFRSPESQQLGFENFDLPLAPTEDIHTNTDAANAFGISLQSNDGINNFGDTRVIPSPVPVTSLGSSIPETEFLNDNGQNFGISSPASKVGTPSDGENEVTSSHTSENLVGLDDVNPFGIPDISKSNEEAQVFSSLGNFLPDTESAGDFSITEVATISDAGSKDISQGLQSGESKNENSLQSLQTTSVEGAGNVQADDVNLASIVNSLTVQNTGKSSSQVLETLGDVTIGDLLQGINGQNGIVVMPMSELTLQQSGSSDEVVVQAPTTTSEAPVTRRRRPGRRRRTTTRPPDHIRTSLSDLWYAKGQWFGTLLGGMIDLGRIAMESFRENSGSSSRDSYT